MAALVERMLALHKQLQAARTGHDQTLLQRQIDATDAQIDPLGGFGRFDGFDRLTTGRLTTGRLTAGRLGAGRLVYDLYGLTAEEIAIVEGSS
ncbi:MAG: hypothetical protein NTW86_14985 [Candidatus Sumerlaeota bacterium]|nr:hypothetical protein [Candidatus Sumerlaeota bacterium]